MKVVKRILLGLVVFVVGLLVLLFGSIIVDGFYGQSRLEPVTNMSMPAADGATIRAYLAKPEGPGPHPAILLIHEFYGLRPELVGKAEALAKEGYVVLAPNVFRDGTTNWIPSAIYKVLTADTAQIDSDVEAAYQWLAAQTDVQADRIAIMGFCFGGGTALRYSLSNNQLAATAVFYGQPISDPVKLKALSGPVLGIFGGADGSIPLNEVEGLRQGLETAGVPHEITIYEGQPHAFVQSMEQIAQGGPQQEAWNQLLAFLKQNLQTGTGALPSQSLTLAEARRGDSSFLYIMRLAWSHLFHHM